MTSRRCDSCEARAQRRAAERAERAAARKAEAERRRSDQRRREADRERRRQHSDELTFRAMLDVAARDKAKGSRIAQHCGGYVAYDGHVYTSEEWRARERQQSAPHALPPHPADE